MISIRWKEDVYVSTYAKAGVLVKVRLYGVTVGSRFFGVMTHRGVLVLDDDLKQEERCKKRRT